MRDQAHALLRDAAADARHLEAWTRLLREHRGWAVLTDDTGQPFTSYESFCVARHPFGLGYDAAAIERIIADRKSAQARAQAPRTLLDQGAPEGNQNAAKANENKGSVTTFVSKRQERGADYLVARIARDHPTILARMQAGEFRSTRAAAIAAGIIKPVASVPVGDNINRTAGHLLNKLSRVQIERLIAALRTGLDARAPD